MRRPPFSLADVVLILSVLALIVGLVNVAQGVFVPFVPNVVEPPKVDLNPLNLPYYLARSTLRMFVALIFSFLFTFVYGYAAARSRRAERVLVPLLDILQSVPVLGFLSITITAFIALFQGSLLGLEAASVFAIFTSQAWNMTFSFYQSLRTVPRELDEAARIYRLPRWQRFVKLEVPFGMLGLVWNAMMSFGGGWFFVAASEAISVLNHTFTLPGIGSYVTEAVAQQDMGALAAAVVAMAVMILAVDQLLWRPLIAWADKFKFEQSEGANAPQSWVLDLIRSAQLPSRLSHALAPLSEVVTRTLSGTLLPRRAEPVPRAQRAPWRYADAAYTALLLLAIIVLTAWLLNFILAEVGFAEVARAFGLGLVTLARVVILVILSSLIYVPLGVAIGFNPRVARIIQPLAQFLSAFPANFLFPFVTLALIHFNISLNLGGILLMSLGAQWYVLFNVIAGAQSIPSDLREMATNFGVHGWTVWRRLIIPGIFSAWVMGAITASGGAWNASIVSEIVSWGDTTLTATGLGAYIKQMTDSGDWPRIALGVGMMSVFVVGFNRLLWRRLYTLAENKYTL
jgi:NitT/TauT family transport system permease protein